MSGPTGVRPPAAVGLVALGGALGSYARVTVSMLVDPALVATLIVNVAGAFALGALLAALADGAGTADGDRGRRRQRARLLLGTGFCGGFTTYSLVAVQVATLVGTGGVAGGAAYGAATLVLGGVATALGMVSGSWRRSRS